MRAFEEKHWVAISRLRGSPDFDVFMHGLLEQRQFLLEEFVKRAPEEHIALQNRVRQIDDIVDAYKNCAKKLATLRKQT